MGSQSFTATQTRGWASCLTIRHGALRIIPSSIGHLFLLLFLAITLSSNAQASTGNAANGQLIWDGSASPYPPYTKWNCQSCHRDGNRLPEGNRFNAANASNVIAHAITKSYGGNNQMDSMAPVNGCTSPTQCGITTAELNDVAAYIATFVPTSMSQAVTYNTARSFTIPNLTLNTGPNPPVTFTSIVTITAPTKGTVSYSGLTATYTPTAGQSGSDSFTYVGRGPAGDSNIRTVNITISQPPPVITSGSTANAATYVNSTPYTITASNSPTSYSALSLPPGLSVNASTGVISGTPTSAGTFTSTVRATNATGTGTKSVTFTIALSAPVITSANTKSGQTGVAFSYVISANSNPTSFNATGLPPGLNVNTSTGQISGTPTTVGSSTVTVSATNATGTGTLAVTFNITLGPPFVNSAGTQSGQTGVALSYAITATNSPTSFSSTALPDGLSLNTSTGVISGTPAAGGSTVVTVSATNGTGTGTKSVTFNITLVAPVITSANSKSGETGVALSYAIQATSSPTSYSSTTLPGGLTLNPSTGIISGTPTTVATSNVTVSATNAAGTGSQVVTFSITLGSPVISSSNTANGVTGSAFSYAITASNSPTSYSSTALPTGLTLNTSTGVISGTPTAAGSTSVTVSATNATGTGTLVVTFNITLGTPAITSANTANGVTGSVFSYNITASNNPTSYSSTVLPAGLSLNASTGVISGTPTAVTTSNVTVSATNATGTGNLVVTFSITLGAPAITSANTVSGATGSALSYAIEASNSPTSYSSTVLPAGLTLNASTGVISGTPTTVATSNVTVSATNATGTGSLSVTFTITLGPPVITSPDTASGTTSSAFSYTITATNSPTSFSSTALPTGLTLNTSTGVISGTPSSDGIYTTTVAASNATGSGSLTVTITISSTAPVITSATTASGATDMAFSYTITATNPLPPTTFGASSLPPGLSLNTSSGVISGTPTTAGTYNSTVTATNSSAETGSQIVTFTISLSAPVVTSATTVSGATGSALSYAITATNNPTSFTASPLAAGLTLNASTGVISGTPTGPTGTTSTVVTASNATGASAPVTVAFTITLGVPVVNSANTANGVTGSAFSYTITATNNPTSFTASPLPAGLTLNASTGVISGTPTEPTGTTNTVVTASNATGSSNPVTVAFTITLGVPAITSANTVSGSTNAAFNYAIIASNSPTSYSSTALPTGLSLNTSTGIISGTPTVEASNNVTVYATNATGTGNLAVTINITLSAPVINSDNTANGATGSAFSYTITALNNPTSFSSSSLPAGLSLNSSTGLISGTPTVVATNNVTVTATNATGSDNLVVTLTVTLGAPIITSSNTATGTTGSAFTYTITADNSPTSFTAPGLPAGLNLNPSTGVISGTPTAVGSTSVTVTATNATGTDSLVVTWTISLGAPVITSANAASGTINTPFSYTITATNSPDSFSSTALPAGLVLNTSTGVISGTPTTEASTAVTVSATNATGTGTLVVTFSIDVGVPTAAVATLTVQLNTATALDLGPFITGTGTSIVVTTPALHGTTSVSGTIVTYIPARNYFGTDAFSYASTNSAGTSAPAVVTITIIGRPDPAKDTNVSGLLVNQLDTSKRFAKAQISNFHQRMEILHRSGPAIEADDADAGFAAQQGSSNFYSGNARNDALQPSLYQARYQGSPAQSLDSHISNPAKIADSPSLMATMLYSALTTSSISLNSLAADEDDTEVNGPGNILVWGAGNVRLGKRDQANGEVVDFRTDGASVGFDRRIDDELALGIGVGYARDKSTIGIDGTGSTSKARSLAVYGSYLPTPTTFIDILVGYGALNFNASRYVLPVDDFAQVQRKGNQTFSSLAFGYEHRSKGLLVSPYGRIDMVNNRLAEGTETGAGTYALQYSSQSWSTSQGVVGMRTEASYQADMGWVLPHVRIEYQRNIENGEQASIVYADQPNGTRYSVFPATANTNSIAAGLGSNFEFNNGLKLGIDYQIMRSAGTAGSAGAEKNHALMFKLSRELGGE